MRVQSGSPRSRIHALVLDTGAFVIGSILAVVLSEAVLRVLPVRDGVKIAPVDAAHPIMHHEPKVDYTWSLGPRLAFPVHGHINNVGWVSHEDYDSTSNTPLMAVVGDSYVEALMVPDSQTMSSRLRADAGPGHRVYPIGVSGAALSQYLAEAEYARRTFRPSALVIVIVGNDFDESLKRYRNSAPGQYTFIDRPDSSLELRREDFTPSRWKRMLGHSALARYLYDQAGITRLFGTLAGYTTRGGRMPSDDEFTGNSQTYASPERIAWSKVAIRTFLSELPARSGLSPDHLVLVLDGVRPELDNGSRRGAGGKSYFEAMRNYMKIAATTSGFEVVDMQQVFERDYQENHHALAFPTDGHWNGYAQGLAAGAVAATKAFRRFKTGVDSDASAPNPHLRPTEISK